MTTIASRLARPTQLSASLADARKRSVQLYRDWYRSAPEIVQLYALNVSPAYIRHCIRERFEANRYVTDQRAIDVLLLKWRQEYQETVNCWKQRDHVEGILLAPQHRPQRSFLQKFYEGELDFGSQSQSVVIDGFCICVIGRDEDAVRPAATGAI